MWAVLQLIITWGPRVVELVFSLLELISKIEDPKAKAAFTAEFKAGPKLALQNLKTRVEAYHAGQQDDGPEPPRAA